MEPFLMEVIESGARPWQFAEKDCTVMSHCAHSDETSTAFMEFCIEKGGSFGQMGSFGYSPLLTAMREKNFNTAMRMFDVMLRKEPRALLAPVTKHGHVLHTVVAESLCNNGNAACLEILKQLLNAGLSVQLEDNHGVSIEKLSRAENGGPLRALLASLEARSIAIELRSDPSLRY